MSKKRGNRVEKEKLLGGYGESQIYFLPIKFSSFLELGENEDRFMEH